MGRIAIAGLGAISALGTNLDSTFLAIAEGVDGLKPFNEFDTGLKAHPSLASISQPLCKVPFSPPSRTAHLAALAIQESLQPISNRKGLRLGLVFATTVGGITNSERVYQHLIQNKISVAEAAHGFNSHEATSCSGYLANMVQAQGFYTLSTACSSGLHAIGMAKRLIEQDQFDLCLAVGADALSLLTIRGFAGLLLLDAAGCRPFDATRAGTSLGEGAGSMLLASDHAMEKRNLSSLGFISGYGSSADCHHMTAPHPEGDGAKRSVKQALLDAQLSSADINAIASHGTGTPDNDYAEIQGMKSVFASLPPFYSVKRSLGHTLGASGTLEAVIAARCLQEGVIPRTVGFNQLDERIGCAPSPLQKTMLTHILKNSFGFGGNNASVIISKSQTEVL